MSAARLTSALLARKGHAFPANGIYGAITLDGFAGPSRLEPPIPTRAPIELRPAERHRPTVTAQPTPPTPLPVDPAWR